MMQKIINIERDVEFICVALDNMTKAVKEQDKALNEITKILKRLEDGLDDLDDDLGAIRKNTF